MHLSSFFKELDALILNVMLGAMVHLGSENIDSIIEFLHAYIRDVLFN